MLAGPWSRTGSVDGCARNVPQRPTLREPEQTEMPYNSPKVRRRARRIGALAIVCLVTPLLMGGCPEFQNASVDAFESATRGVVNAALDLLFDQYRNNNP